VLYFAEEFYQATGGESAMTYAFPPDLRELVSEQMASGKYASEDELLRHALRALSEEEEDLAAVSVALADWQSGDKGVSLDEAFATIRARHNLGSDT
jgi:putative addiction module CopG family antidote